MSVSFWFVSYEKSFIFWGNITDLNLRVTYVLIEILCSNVFSFLSICSIVNYTCIYFPFKLSIKHSLFKLISLVESKLYFIFRFSVVTAAILDRSPAPPLTSAAESASPVRGRNDLQVRGFLFGRKDQSMSTVEFSQNNDSPPPLTAFAPTGRLYNNNN